MKLKTIKQIKNLTNKKVLVRCDFNIPVENGKVKEDYRIEKTLPTIEYLIKKGAEIILMSHFGRPKGKVVSGLRLTPHAKRLSELLGKKVKKLSVSTGSSVIKEINKMKKGDVIMLENIQFESGEITKDAGLARELASYGDYFVNECFAQSHRDYGSISKITEYIPSYAGLLLEQEINGLSKALIKPKKPFVVVLGGAKIETKIPVMKNLLTQTDYILIGGGIVNTYLWAKGYKVGKSLINKKFKKEALLYGKKKKVIIPVDLVVGTIDGKKHKLIKLDKNFKVKRGWGIYDIGPETIKLYSKYIKKAQTLVWNGAMGYFEQHPYQYGTHSIAHLVASRSKGKAFGVCGGGETVEVLKKLRVMKNLDLVSTGGGAMLEFLAGKKLPGVEVVKK
jgi:phosphoglycerate kinase